MCHPLRIKQLFFLLFCVDTFYNSQKQEAIISSKFVNWLVFVMKTNYV